VIPSRSEPFIPLRRPEHPEQVPVTVQGPVTVQAQAGSGAASSYGHGSVHGATAMQPEAFPASSGLVERDPNVNKSLLLRLIAGVRGL
jgi:hypothetical protein